MYRRSVFAFVLAGLVVVTAGPAIASHDPTMGVFVDESSRATFNPDPEALVTHVAPLDHDLDGDTDLFITIGNANGVQDKRNSFLLNDGLGSLRRARAVAREVLSDYTHVAFGDLNGDARADAILSVNLAPERLLLFDPARNRWVDRTNRRIPANQPDDVTISSELFDADGDGDLDVVTAVEDPFVLPGAQNRLWLNDGAATFTDVTATHMPAILDDSAAFAIGDFDSDGDLDVITVNAEADFYLENDGTGHFTDQTAGHLPPQPTNRNSGRDAVVADFDADGDLDVVFAISRSDEGPVLWLNDGAGIFTDATTGRIPVATLSTQAVAACDLEGDGDLDLVLANSGAVLIPPTDHLFAGAPERILVNNGAATFSDASDHIPQNLDGSQTVACADFTGDGRLDIVVGNGKAEELKVYVQD